MHALVIFFFVLSQFSRQDVDSEHLFLTSRLIDKADEPDDAQTTSAGVRHWVSLPLLPTYHDGCAL